LLDFAPIHSFTSQSLFLHCRNGCHQDNDVARLLGFWILGVRKWGNCANDNRPSEGKAQALAQWTLVLDLEGVQLDFHMDHLAGLRLSGLGGVTRGFVGFELEATPA
jgi:hypothetical protein